MPLGVYTPHVVNSSQSLASLSRNQGAIIGGGVSAIVLLVFTVALALFLKRRRRARLSETIAPYIESTSLGVTTAGLQNFTGRPKRYSLNTITSVANQPVEAGLMSLEINDPRRWLGLGWIEKSG